MSDELGSLRHQVAVLSDRLLALTERVAFLEENTPVTVHSPVTFNYSVASDLPPTNSAPAASTQAPVAPTLAPAGADPERLAVAREVGSFLKRALAGLHRGTSGRDRIKLASRVYVLVRDIHGEVYNPPRLYRTFAHLKPLVKEGNNTIGDSIFIGLPSIWEARIAVEEAGLSWSQSIHE